MQKMGQVPSENEIQDILANDLIDKGHMLIVPNTTALSPVWTYGGEADLLSVTRSGYLHEYEIKRTRSDLLTELKSRNYERDNGRCPNTHKRRKHQGMEKVLIGQEDPKGCPSRFHIVLPPNIYDPDEIPDHWGIHQLRNHDISGTRIEKDRMAKQIHNEKVKREVMLKITRNLTTRYWYDY